MFSPTMKTMIKRAFRAYLYDHHPAKGSCLPSYLATASPTSLPLVTAQESIQVGIDS